MRQIHFTPSFATLNCLNTIKMEKPETFIEPLDTKKRKMQRIGLHMLILLAIGATLIKFTGLGQFSAEITPDSFNCPDTVKITPKEDPNFSDLSYFKTPEYRNYSVGVWAKSVQLATESFDDMRPVGDDKRWDIFYSFEKYLLDTFPKINAASELVHVNTHGLVFILAGSDKSLKPILLTGHQDVVPVPSDTVPRWTYPPFTGHFDGEYLWGRGSSDCKNTVVGLMEAIESLLTRGFTHKRTIVIAFGFDEEISGHYGASYISKYLLQRYGEDSLFLIIDEGGLGVTDLYGSRFALPGTGEKGYVDINIDLLTNGGHSSVPPLHTSIGILAELVHLIEENRYPLRISDSNPLYYMLHCEAKYSKGIDPTFKSDIAKMDTCAASKERILNRLDEDILSRYLVSTSQAVDIFNGGLKINALPEKVSAKINHRVAYDSSTDEVKTKILTLTKKVAKKYGLELDAFGAANTLGNLPDNELPKGKFILTAIGELDPAPLTPVENNPTWDLIGGTIRHVYEDFAVFPDSDPSVDPKVQMSPAVMTGNTDTRYYWKLTPNIYRFSPIRSTGRYNAHAIDERVSLDNHIEGVVYYYELLRNIEEYDSGN